MSVVPPPDASYLDDAVQRRRDAERNNNGTPPRSHYDQWRNGSWVDRQSRGTRTLIRGTNAVWQRSGGRLLRSKIAMGLIAIVVPGGPIIVGGILAARAATFVAKTYSSHYREEGKPPGLRQMGADTRDGVRREAASTVREAQAVGNFARDVVTDPSHLVEQAQNYVGLSVDEVRAVFQEELAKQTGGKSKTRSSSKSHSKKTGKAASKTAGSGPEQTNAGDNVIDLQSRRAVDPKVATDNAKQAETRERNVRTASRGILAALESTAARTTPLNVTGSDGTIQRVDLRPLDHQLKVNLSPQNIADPTQRLAALLQSAEQGAGLPLIEAALSEAMDPRTNSEAAALRGQVKYYADYRPERSSVGASDAIDRSLREPIAASAAIEKSLAPPTVGVGRAG